MRKRIILLLIAIVSVLIITACGSNGDGSGDVGSSQGRGLFTGGNKASLTASSANKMINGGLIDASGDKIFYVYDGEIYQYENGESVYLTKCGYETAYGCFLNATDNELIYLYGYPSAGDHGGGDREIGDNRDGYADYEIRKIDISGENPSEPETIYDLDDSIYSVEDHLRTIIFMQLYDGYIYVAESGYNGNGPVNLYRFKYPYKGDSPEDIELIYSIESGPNTITFRRACIYDDRIYIIGYHSVISMSLNGEDVKEGAFENPISEEDSGVSTATFIDDKNSWTMGYAFHDQNLYYNVVIEYCNDSGEVFGENLELWKMDLKDLSSSKVGNITDSNKCEYMDVSMTAVGDSVYVAWKEGKGNDVFHRYDDIVTKMSTDGALVEEIYREKCFEDIEEKDEEDSDYVDRYTLYYPMIDSIFSVNDRIYIFSENHTEEYAVDNNYLSFRITETDPDFSERNNIAELYHPTWKDDDGGSVNEDDEW